MDKERILALADKIESEALLEQGFGFAMSLFGGEPTEASPLERWRLPECHTAACIAGHATLLSLQNEGKDLKAYHWMLRGINAAAAGRDWLDLSTAEAHKLFVPEAFYHEKPDGGSALVAPLRASPAMAAKVLRHLAETGKVDWTIIGADLARQDQAYAAWRESREQAANG